jgi:hypothetical protein
MVRRDLIFQQTEHKDLSHRKAHLFLQQEHPFQLPELDLQLLLQGGEEEQQLQVKVKGEAEAEEELHRQVKVKGEVEAEEEHHVQVKVKGEAEAEEKLQAQHPVKLQMQDQGREGTAVP